MFVGRGATSPSWSWPRSTRSWRPAWSGSFGASDGSGAGSRGAEPTGSSGGAALPRRWVGAFGRFWWDFLIGDTPELTLGAVAAVGAAGAIALDRSLVWLAVVVLPLVVVLALGGAVRRTARR